MILNELLKQLYFCFFVIYTELHFGCVFWGIVGVCDMMPKLVTTITHGFQLQAFVETIKLIQT